MEYEQDAMKLVNEMCDKKAMVSPNVFTDDALIKYGQTVTGGVIGAQSMKRQITKALVFLDRYKITLGDCSMQELDPSLRVVVGSFTIEMIKGNTTTDKRIEIHLIYRGELIQSLQWSTKLKTATHYLKEKDITHLASAGNHSIIHAAGKFYKVNRSLKSHLDDLSDCFVQVRRDLIVNMNHIEKILPNEMFLKNGERFIIPRKTYTKILRKVNAWFGKDMREQ